ncbi:hypothetical protein AK812_SmicGene34585 [Symbiodinium microadriaticum]|uniref:Uncharacterized protein n=1 Tax=Symbiodinium microadriaticum TaxID=2951 RepID=A0A1Q9CNN2_SYMMI|nr:hypothetical protein AK812_SmicGene34585 [Symbiodinium microadriaticum]
MTEKDKRWLKLTRLEAAILAGLFALLRALVNATALPLRAGGTSDGNRDQEEWGGEAEEVCQGILSKQEVLLQLTMLVQEEQAMRRDTDKLDGCGTVASIREQPEVRVRIPGPVESGKKLEVQLNVSLDLEKELKKKVMKKETNGEITNCQTDSACLLMSISVSRERKKQKEETLTAINWLGAAQANWNTRWILLLCLPWTAFLFAGTDPAVSSQKTSAKASRKGLSSAVVKDCTMAAAALFGTTGRSPGKAAAAAGGSKPKKPPRQQRKGRPLKMKARKAAQRRLPQSRPAPGPRRDL